jgi:hypothetical protein
LDKAHNIAAQVGQAVASWRKKAAKLGLTSGEIDRIASAFEHEHLKAARAVQAGSNIRKSHREHYTASMEEREIMDSLHQRSAKTRRVHLSPVVAMQQAIASRCVRQNDQSRNCRE